MGIGAVGAPSGLSRSLLLRPAADRLLPTALHQPHRRGSDVDFLRGFGFQGYSGRSSWGRALSTRPASGAELKQRLRNPGPLGNAADRFRRNAAACGQPRDAARVAQGSAGVIPLVHIDCTHGDNERRLAERANRDADADADGGGLRERRAARRRSSRPGHSVHEMGTARMGHDPATSVLNGRNQAHDVPQPVHHRRVVHDLDRVGESVADLHGAVGTGGELRRGPALGVSGGDLAARPAAAPAGPHAHDELAKSGGEGRAAAGSASASANRMRAAQAEDSAITVILPLSRVQRFTLFARSGSQCLHYCDLPLGRLGRRKGTLGESWQARRD